VSHSDSRKKVMARRLLIAVLAVASLLAVIGAIPPPVATGTAPASTAAPNPTVPWTGTNPYGFALFDSVGRDCGERFGMDWRSLGMVGWPGANTTMMRQRLTSMSEGWPWTTEPSNAEERQWFRDAGFLTVGLGAIDVKTIPIEEFVDNVDWLLQQSRGRPVMWFNIVNPPFQAEVDIFNDALDAAAIRWPNLKIMDWERWVDEHPGSLIDGVHVATPFACTEGRDRLIRHAAPDIPGQTAPRGWWYGGTTGWGAANTPNLAGPLEVNVRADYAHVGRWPVVLPTDDPWALAASGRGWSVMLPTSTVGMLVCMDLVDAAGQFTPLGCARR
jgi:hypothetical protein